MESGLSYNELLLSVREVSLEDTLVIKNEKELESDASVIEAIKHCILAGIKTKMILADAAAEKVGVSKRQTLKIIEKYTGTDASYHQWSFVVKERGAKEYALLQSTNEQ